MAAPNLPSKIVPSRASDTPVTLTMWSAGMNSMSHPADLYKGQYYYGENVINRGGILQTRPGYGYIRAFPGTRLQGMFTYRPRGGSATMLLAVDGAIHMAKWPFREFVRLPNLSFSASAPIITFTPTLKAVTRSPDETITLIDPYTVVIIQDGVTPAGMFDGSESRHLRAEAPLNETPTGLWGAWSGGRYWVARAGRVYASDLADPLAFFDTDLLAQASGFELPDECTGMIETSTGSGLLVFTEKTTTLFKSNILERTEWRITPDFQKVIIPHLGCIAGRSLVNQYGTTHWYSRSGLVSLDIALNANRSSEVVTLDGQMSRSKARLAPNQSQISAAAFGNLLLCSVPSGSRRNTHTWVLDQSPIEQGSEGGKMAPRAWAGIWTGTRPVSWSSVPINGRERCYFASYDENAKDASQIHLWEAFDISKRDDGNRPLCQIETAMVKLPEKHRFRYAEIDLCELLGPVEFRVFFGTEAGPWIKVKDTRLVASSGCFGSPNQRTINIDSVIRSFKPQTRTVRTEEFSGGPGDCEAETKNAPGQGRYFQFLIEWRGRCGIKEIRAIFTPTSDGKTGACEPDELGEIRMVSERGVTLEAQP